MADEEDLSDLEECEFDDAEGADGFDDEGGELAEEQITEEAGELDEAAEPAPTEALGPDTSARAYRGHGDSVYSVDVSADGVWAATGSGDDSAHVWRLADCAPLAVLPSGSDTVSCVAFSASGGLLACGSYDSVVRVYAMAAMVAAAPGGGAVQPPPLHSLEGPSGDINFLAWHPKGDVLLAGSADGTAWMWSAPAGGAAATCMQVFAGHAGAVAAGLFTRDGRLVVTGGEDGSVRVWAPKTGACTKVFQLGEAPVTSLVSSPSDAAMVCAATMEGHARIINLTSQRIVLSVDHNDKEDSASVREAGGARAQAEADEEEDLTSVERCGWGPRGRRPLPLARSRHAPTPRAHSPVPFFPLPPPPHPAAWPFAPCSPGSPRAPRTAP